MFGRAQGTINGRRKRRFGGALGLVLAVAALALLAAFTAATVATLNLRMASNVANTSIADGLAESVVQEAVANLQQDFAYHTDISIGPGLGLPDGSKGWLTFDKKSADPYSTNNFLGDDADGWKRTLPDKTIHLIGIGECGGVRRCVEAVVHAPEYPVTAACSGPVRVKNSLIAGFEPADDRDWEPGSGYSVEEDELKPGHLVTNSASSTSIVLDAGTKITGDVQSRGGVRLNGAKVEGEVRAPWGSDAPIPDFDIETFDPKSSEDIYYEELTAVPSTATLVGNVRYEGDLTMSGNLTLDNAYLYVKGNVTLNGELKGVGGLIATGAVKFKGAVDITSNDEIAVLTGGGLELTGTSASRNIFRGLLYTQGPFVGKKVTIVGGFVVDKGQPTDLQDTSVFYSGQYILPEMKQQTAAVVPRFYVPTASEMSGDLKNNPQRAGWDKGRFGYFMGGRPHVPRTVANVTDITNPHWSRSDWNQFDPAVVSVKWIGDQPVFRYEYWGHADSSPNLDNAVQAVFDPLSFNDLVDVVSNQNTASNVYSNLNGTPPNKAAYAAYLTEILNHIQKTNPTTGSNLQFDINEFVNKGDRLRFLLYRKF